MRLATDHMDAADRVIRDVAGRVERRRRWRETALYVVGWIALVAWIAATMGIFGVGLHRVVQIIAGRIG